MRCRHSVCHLSRVVRSALLVHFARAAHCSTVRPRCDTAHTPLVRIAARAPPPHPFLRPCLYGYISHDPMSCCVGYLSDLARRASCFAGTATARHGPRPRVTFCRPRAVARNQYVSRSSVSNTATPVVQRPQRLPLVTASYRRACIRARRPPRHLPFFLSRSHVA